MIKIIKATEDDTKFIKGYYNYPSLITNGTHKNVVGIGESDQYKISKNGDNVELLSWNSGMGYIAIALYSGDDLRLLQTCYVTLEDLQDDKTMIRLFDRENYRKLANILWDYGYLSEATEYNSPMNCRL